MKIFFYCKLFIFNKFIKIFFMSKKFEWNENKNSSNIKKHGINFEYSAQGGVLTVQLL